MGDGGFGVVPRDESELNMGEFVSVAERRGFFFFYFRRKDLRRSTFTEKRKGGGTDVVCCEARDGVKFDANFCIRIVHRLKKSNSSFCR